MTHDRLRVRGAALPAGRQPAPKFARRMRRISPRSLAVCVRQLSVMIDAGLPLAGSLELLAREEPAPALARALVRVQGDLEAGASLAEAMARQPHAFSPLFTQMVAAGEAAGRLDVIFKRLATLIEKQARLRAQVRAALLYPGLVLAVATLVVAILLWKVIPTFASLFAGFDAALPLPTRIVIGMSDLFVQGLPVLVIGGGGLAMVMRRYANTVAGRLKRDGLLLRLPLVGPSLRKVAVAHFCRTLGTLLTSGVPILTGLDITASISGNAVVEAAVRAARVAVERGETLAAPLRSTGVFPAQVTQMIAVGEHTGALDQMLARVADFYEEEVDAAVAGLVTILEPALIAALGVVVGGIIISMYLPLFQIINQLA